MSRPDPNIAIALVNELEKVSAELMKPLPPLVSTKLIQFGNSWINPEKIVSVVVKKKKGYSVSYVATLRLSYETEPYFGPSFDTTDKCKNYIAEFITKNNLK